MYNLSKFTKKLEDCHTNKLALIYQWVKSDSITFIQFQELLEWLNSYQLEQVTYDNLD